MNLIDKSEDHKLEMSPVSVQVNCTLRELQCKEMYLFSYVIGPTPASNGTWMCANLSVMSKQLLDVFPLNCVHPFISRSGSKFHSYCLANVSMLTYHATCMVLDS